jgi:hypothetical protein
MVNPVNKPLHYQIIDSVDPRREKEFSEFVEKEFGWTRADDVQGCDVLIVHENSDTPEQIGARITREQVRDLKERHGIYARYTGGGDEWVVAGPSEFYGSLDELRNRLTRLHPPIDRDDMRRVLQRHGGGLIESIAILCQGYLVAYVQHPPLPTQPSIIKALLRCGIAVGTPDNPQLLAGLPSISPDQAERIQDRTWWRSVLGPMTGGLRKVPEEEAARRLESVMEADWRAAGGRTQTRDVPPVPDPDWVRVRALVPLLFPEALREPGPEAGMTVGGDRGLETQVVDTLHGPQQNEMRALVGARSFRDEDAAVMVADAYLAIANLLGGPWRNP